MSKVTTPDGHAIEIVPSYDPKGGPLLDISSVDPKDHYFVHIRLSRENLVDLMYEFAKAKIKLDERR